MSFLSQVLLFSAAFCIIMFCYAVVRLVSIHHQLDSAVRGKLEELQSRLGGFEKRLGLIQGHALDYMNSISGEGSKALYQLQQILISQREMIQEIESYLATQDLGALKKADRLLEQTLSPSSLTVNGGRDRSGNTVENWESRSEELLQTLGLDISLASQSSQEAGFNRCNRKRRGTNMNLQEAGIIAAIRDPKTPTGKH